MASENEIERLVVRLVGEGSSYYKMLQQAQTSSQETTHAVEQSTKVIEGFQQGLQQFGDSALKSLEALGAAEFLKKSFEAFSGREQTLIKLTAALENNGREVKETIKDYKEFAKAMASVSMSSGGEVLMLLKKAETYNLTGDAAKAAAKNAIALAAATDQDTGSTFRLVAMLAQGNIQRAMQLSRSIPQLKSIKDESKFVAEAQKLIAGGMKTLEAQSKSTEGVMHHFQSSLKALYADFGESVAQGVKPYIEGLKEMVDWLRNLSPETKRTIVTIAELATATLGIGGAWKTLAKAVGITFSPWIAGMVALGYGVSLLIDRLGGVTEVWKMVRERGEGAWEYIKVKIAEFVAWVHPVTQSIISLFSTAWGMVKTTAEELWSGFKVGLEGVYNYWSEKWGSMGITVADVMVAVRDNVQNGFLYAEFSLKKFGATADFLWAKLALGIVVVGTQMEEIFMATLNNVIQMFQNMGQSIVNIITNLPNAIKGQGKQWSELMVPLTENMVQAQHVKGPIEELLEQDVKRAGDMLNKEFQEFKTLKKQGFDAANWEEAEWQQAVIPDKDVEALRKSALNVGSGIGASIGKGLKEGGGKFDAALAGSAEALSRIDAYKDKLANERTNPSQVSNEPSSTTGPEARRTLGEELLQQLVDMQKKELDRNAGSINIEVAALGSL